MGDFMHKHNISALTALKPLVAMGDECVDESIWFSIFCWYDGCSQSERGNYFVFLKKGWLCVWKSLHIYQVACRFFFNYFKGFLNMSREMEFYLRSQQQQISQESTNNFNIWLVVTLIDFD